ncbi:MAG TPA: carbohydrate ABC transporter permease [Spirillospora sp.]|nr:carbohydrate ABC transporter permease [Spirillospora sp.]
MSAEQIAISDQQALLRRRLATAGVLVALTLAAFIVLLPIIWTFSTSLRIPKESFALPPKWLPTDFQWYNYVEVFNRVPFGRYILNSLIVSITSVLGQIVTATLAAYAFARLRFPGKNVLFILLMSALMVPFFVTVIPVFILISRLGLVDTLWSLILPTLVTPFGVFLLRQFFLTIPNELEDAAKMDGAGPLQIFRYVFLPLGAPGIAVMAILAFNGQWNDFFRPFIFLFSQENYTLPLGIVTLRGPLDTGELSVVLAGVMISMVPMILMLIFAQRYLIEGIVLTGTKG